jgi:2-polyprenyl-3-methyl-5-hydroxy-6-metoxy-1,4-benzoquinol methylase
MTDYPEGFVADLRQTKSWPALEGSLWRAPHLVQLTFAQAYDLIAEWLPAAPASILEVGTGTGFLSLEMARAGHRVVALDADEKAIAVATATLHSDPSIRVAVTCELGDVVQWNAPPESFDVVVVSRALHHVADPAAALANVRRWLRPGGRLICLDFAFDLFDRRAARWLAATRALLEAASALASQDLTAHDARDAVTRVYEDWQREHREHDLRTWTEMSDPLYEHFEQQHLSWHPYLYWEVLADLRSPTPSIEEALGSTVMQWEQRWLSDKEIPSVLFLFVGTPRE